MSCTTSRKSFAGLHEAEAFFHASCNERAAGAETLARFMLPELQTGKRTRLMDFGGGDGRFLSEALMHLGPAANHLSIAAVDVDVSCHREYMTRLRPSSRTPIQVTTAWPSCALFDVIVANHVLYYVDDMQRWVARAAHSMAPRARAYITMGSPRPPMSQLWGELFKLVDQPLPYLGTEDLERELSRAGLPFEIHRIPFRVAFEATEEKRSLFLQFLVGAHYAAIAPRASGLIDRFSTRKGGQIVFEHEDWLYCVSSRP